MCVFNCQSHIALLPGATVLWVLLKTQSTISGNDTPMGSQQQQQCSNRLCLAPTPYPLLSPQCPNAPAAACPHCIQYGDQNKLSGVEKNDRHNFPEMWIKVLEDIHKIACSMVCQAARFKRTYTHRPIYNNTLTRTQ